MFKPDLKESAAKVALKQRISTPVIDRRAPPSIGQKLKGSFYRGSFSRRGASSYWCPWRRGWGRSDSGAVVGGGFLQKMKEKGKGVGRVGGGVGTGTGTVSQPQSITQKGVHAHPLTAREREHWFLQPLSHSLAANFGRQ